MQTTPGLNSALPKSALNYGRIHIATSDPGSLLMAAAIAAPLPSAVAAGTLVLTSAVTCVLVLSG